MTAASHLSHRPMCKAMVNSLHSLRSVYYLFSVHIVHMGTINSTHSLSFLFICSHKLLFIHFVSLSLCLSHTHSLIHSVLPYICTKSRIIKLKLNVQYCCCCCYHHQQCHCVSLRNLKCHLMPFWLSARISAHGKTHIK